MLTAEDARWPLCSECGKVRADFHSHSRSPTFAPGRYLCLDCAVPVLPAHLRAGDGRDRLEAEVAALRSDPTSLSYREPA